MNTAHHLREAIAHLDQACDGEPHVKIREAIRSVRARVEKIHGSTLRRDKALVSPIPLCDACGGTGRITDPESVHDCYACFGEGVRRACS